MADRWTVLFFMVWILTLSSSSLRVQANIDPDDPAQNTIPECTSTCDRPWLPVLKVDANGSVVHGSIDELRRLSLGANLFRIKMYRTDGIYLLNVDNTNVKGEHVCAESLWHVSDNGTHISTSVEWRYMMVCTNGKVWIVNSPFARPENWTIASNASLAERLQDAEQNYGILNETERVTVWLTKPMGCDKPVYSHFLDGSPISGSIKDLITLSSTCEPHAVMRDRGYSFLINSIVYDSTAGEVNGQSIGHIGQEFTSDALKFKVPPYYWFSSWSTPGPRDNSRWLVGTVQPRGHNNDYVALEWYVDSCWREVYVNMADGQPESGSLDELIFQISLGHRVRFQYDNTVLEANSIRVADQTVIAQSVEEISRRGGSGSDKYFFNTESMWQWTTAHTTGSVKINIHRVRDMTYFSKSREAKRIRWMVDTRPWRRVFDTPPGPYSDINNLVAAVQKGASVRFNIQQDYSAGFFFTNADNVRLDTSDPSAGVVVYAQCLRHISDRKDPLAPREYEIQQNPFRWILMACSDGFLSMAAWKTQEREQLYNKLAPSVNLTWYVCD